MSRFLDFRCIAIQGLILSPPHTIESPVTRTSLLILTVPLMFASSSVVLPTKYPLSLRSIKERPPFPGILLSSIKPTFPDFRGRVIQLCQFLRRSFLVPIGFRGWSDDIEDFMPCPSVRSQRQKTGSRNGVFELSIIFQ